jgi:hypothetical protein
VLADSPGARRLSADAGAAPPPADRTEPKAPAVKQPPHTANLTADQQGEVRVRGKGPEPPSAGV